MQHIHLYLFFLTIQIESRRNIPLCKNNKSGRKKVFFQKSVVDQMKSSKFVYSEHFSNFPSVFVNSFRNVSGFRVEGTLGEGC